MEDVVFLARFTSSGINPTLNMEVGLFEKCLESALNQYELENKKG